MFLSDIRARNIVGTIFSFFENPQDLARGERVCRVWREVAKQEWKFRWQKRLNLDHPPAGPLSGEQKEALYSEYRVQRLEEVKEPFGHNRIKDAKVANGYLFRPVPSTPQLQQIDFKTQQVVHSYSPRPTYVVENNRLVFYGESIPVEIWDIETGGLLLKMETISGYSHVSVNKSWLVTTTVANELHTVTIMHTVTPLDEGQAPFSFQYGDRNYLTETLLDGDRFYALTYPSVVTHPSAQIIGKSSLRVWDLTTRNEIDHLLIGEESFTKMVPWNDQVFLANKHGVVRWKLGEPDASRFIDFPEAENVFLFQNDKNVLAMGSLGSPIRLYSLLDGEMIRELGSPMTFSADIDFSDTMISLVSMMGSVTQFAVPTTASEVSTMDESSPVSEARKRRRSGSLE